MTTKRATVIDLDRLKQLMLEFVAERGSDEDTLYRQLLFSEFVEWLRRRQDEQASNHAISGSVEASGSTQ